jgi:hypothetical protein
MRWGAGYNAGMLCACVCVMEGFCSAPANLLYLWDLHGLKLVCGKKLKLDFVVASSQHTLLSSFTEAGLGVAF